MLYETESVFVAVVYQFVSFLDKFRTCYRFSSPKVTFAAEAFLPHMQLSRVFPFCFGLRRIMDSHFNSLFWSRIGFSFRKVGLESESKISDPLISDVHLLRFKNSTNSMHDPKR